jgi:hypothetical protein
MSENGKYKSLTKALLTARRAFLLSTESYNKILWN